MRNRITNLERYLVFRIAVAQYLSYHNCRVDVLIDCSESDLHERNRFVHESDVPELSRR